MADGLRRRGALVEFVGSEEGIERTLVPRAGYRLYYLPLRSLSGGPVARARAGLLFLRALGRCRRLLGDLRPDAVLGVGGYASAPAVVAAGTMKIPTFLHEQNSVPGRVNRAASRITSETFVTFPAAEQHLRHAVRVGMPTREELFGASRERSLRELGLAPPLVLIFGGSGGALSLNLAAAEAFGLSTPYTVVQIAGSRDFPRLSTTNEKHVILEYADDIWRYLAAADVVVSRAGAGSLFDAAAVGRACILVPFPYAAGDHQLHNARFFTERGAAELMLDRDVDAGALRERVEALLQDHRRRDGLSSRMRELATPEAADEVAARLLRAAARKE